MFTVLILSDAAKSIFDRSEMFFTPFVDTGKIAFCQWNQAPGAVTLAEALPDLPVVIRGKSEWRAIVVDHPLVVDDPAQRCDGENPFDYVDNTDTAPGLTSSPHPMVRIAHLLLGYPELGAQSFEPVLEYREPVTGEPKQLSGAELRARYPDLDTSEAIARESQDKYDARVHYREIEYGPAQKERHRALVEQYRMKEIRPSEVVFVSTRTPVEEDPRTQLLRAWSTESEQGASRFVERNDYPPMSRFAVYELLNPENSGYDQDELRLWLSVLSLAVNLLPPSTFQSDRVYRLEVELSEDQLGSTLNAHMSRLGTIRDHLEGLLRRPQAPPETTVTELLEPQKVALAFDRLGGEELRVSTTGYSLASDRPRDEIGFWREEYDQLVLETSQFVRKPRRVLARAVFDARVKARSFLDKDYVLSDLDQEELELELGKRLLRLARPTTTSILDRSRIAAALERHDRDVTGLVAQRMPFATILTASLVVLGIWAASFVPFMIQAWGKGTTAFFDSLLVVLAVLGAIAGVGVVTLFWMRRRLVRRLRVVNTGMRSFVRNVNDGASVFAAYLSDLATFMHAQSILLGARRFRGRERSRNREREALLGEIRDVIAREKKIVTSLGVPVQVQRLTSGLETFDPDDPHEVSRLFRIPVGDRRADFNESGDTIDAPYDFVTRLTLDRVSLFERRSGRG